MNKWSYNGTEFNVGDKVRVVRRTEDFAPNGMGEGIMWENQWIKADNDGPNMDRYLGLEFEIDYIVNTGVLFKDWEAWASYAFPLSSLENISTKEVV